MNWGSFYLIWYPSFKLIISTEIIIILRINTKKKLFLQTQLATKITSLTSVVNFNSFELF